MHQYLAVVVWLAALVVAGSPALAEVTRSMRAELDPGVEPFAVENLAGSMRVVPGSGPVVVVVATVHAEDQRLADVVRIERVPDRRGVPRLLVRYPVDRHSQFRYPGAEGGFGGGWLQQLLGGGSRIEYDDHRVSVTSGGGVLLYADVEIQVPTGARQGTFRNHVGALSGERIEGNLTFDTASGNIVLRDLKGDIVADTGSGDVRATQIQGSLRCDTGSGDCAVEGFRGETLVCDTGSGEVQVRGADARRVGADTGSGTVELRDVDAEVVVVDTGSGNVRVEIDADSRRLSRVEADTGSGDVRLRLGQDASFEVRADLGSGDIVNRYADAEPILRRREVVGYRRGDGRVRIEVDTGSGDLVLEP